jgi:excisionase family DNA binding protein
MDKLLLRPIEAADRIGMGRSKTYALIKEGTIPSIRIGAAVRVPARALEEWVNALADQEKDAP